MAQELSPHALHPGQKVQWYRIVDVLGQGGFGITYLAQDLNLNQKVAIKEYLPIEVAVRGKNYTLRPATKTATEQYRWGLQRFVTEAQTLAKFDHPNIVRVHAVFAANGTAYMVMRFEEGESLQEILERKRILEERELLDLAVPLLNGLSKVHATGFVHRDIKPANIYIRKDNSPVLIDFGSARGSFGQTMTMTSMVSVGYAPFEQYQTKATKQGPWTDIYALGAVLFRGLTGSTPTDALERGDNLLSTVKDKFPKLEKLLGHSYSPGFLAAIDHALEFRLEDRPQSAELWRDELIAGCQAAGQASGAAPNDVTSNRTPLPSASDGATTAPTQVSPQTTQASDARSQVIGASGDDGASEAPTVPRQDLKESGRIPEQGQAETGAKTLVIEAPQPPAMERSPRPVSPASPPPAQTQAAPVQTVNEDVDGPPGGEPHESAMMDRDGQGGDDAQPKLAEDGWMKRYGKIWIPGVAVGLSLLIGLAVLLTGDDEGAGEGEAVSEAAPLADPEPSAGVDAPAKDPNTLAAPMDGSEISPALASGDEMTAVTEPAESAPESLITPPVAAAITVQPSPPAAPRFAPLTIFNDTLRDGSQGPSLVVLPKGRFIMGSPDDEQGRGRSERHQDEVTIDYSFAMGQFELTFAAYDRFAEATGRDQPKDSGDGRGRKPVVNVSWHDAVAYTEWLSFQTGERYRLPTEAEWEYAARAQTTTSRYWGDELVKACAFANVYDQTAKPILRKRWPHYHCSDGAVRAAEVGQYQPNGFGLYDMLGNAREWVQDCWKGSYRDAPLDGSPQTGGDCSRRVVRGGGWYGSLSITRAAARNEDRVKTKESSTGFRIVRDIKPPPMPSANP